MIGAAGSASPACPSSPGDRGSPWSSARGRSAAFRAARRTAPRPSTFFFSLSAAICCSSASCSSTSARIAGSRESTVSAPSARPVPRNSAAASRPSPPSSSVACSVSSSPFCWNACDDLRLRVLERLARPTRGRCDRDRRPASLKASTKNSGNCVSLRSPPVLVAVTTTRPGRGDGRQERAARARRVDERDALRRQLRRAASSSPRRSGPGPGRLNAACRAVEAAVADQQDDDRVARLARAPARSANAFSTPALRRLLVGEIA